MLQFHRDDLRIRGQLGFEAVDDLVERLDIASAAAAKGAIVILVVVIVVIGNCRDGNGSAQQDCTDECTT